MATIRYYGEVRPLQLALSVPYTPRFLRSGAQEDPDGEFEIQIQGGRALVRVQVDEADLPDPFDLYIPALRAAQLLADVAGFLEGVPYTVVLDWVETADGELKTAILAQREMALLCTTAGLDDIESIFDEAINSIALAQTLSDAIKMLYLSDYAPVAAGRIADSLARLISGSRGQSAWVRLHTELRVSRTFVEPLSEHSKPARHGERVYVPAETVRLLADRSWTLISRYLAWKINGPLDAEKFPQLAG